MDYSLFSFPFFRGQRPRPPQPPPPPTIPPLPLEPSGTFSD